MKTQAKQTGVKPKLTTKETKSLQSTSDSKATSTSQYEALGFSKSSMEYKEYQKFINSVNW